MFIYIWVFFPSEIGTSVPSKRGRKSFCTPSSDALELEKVFFYLNKGFITSFASLSNSSIHTIPLSSIFFLIISSISTLFNLIFFTLSKTLSKDSLKKKFFNSRILNFSILFNSLLGSVISKLSSPPFNLDKKILREVLSYSNRITCVFRNSSRINTLR